MSILGCSGYPGAHYKLFRADIQGNLLKLFPLSGNAA